MILQRAVFFILSTRNIQEHPSRVYSRGIFCAGAGTHLRNSFCKKTPRRDDSYDLVNRIFTEKRKHINRLARFAGFAKFVPVNYAWRAWQAWRKQKLDL